jgi:hypothetical protein
MTTHRPLAAAVACLLAAGACSDSTLPGEGSGGLRFQFAGASTGTGSFAAAGDVPTRSSAAIPPQFAAAVRDTANGEPLIILLGWQPTGGGHGHFVEMDLAESKSGETLSMSDLCLLHETLAGCALALVGIDWDMQSTTGVGGDSFYFDAGSLTVASVTRTGIRGTFRGHAVDGYTGHSITITNGSFDVPFVRLTAASVDRLPAAVRARAQRLLH